MIIFVTLPPEVVWVGVFRRRLFGEWPKLKGIKLYILYEYVYDMWARKGGGYNSKVSLSKLFWRDLQHA